MQQLIITKVPEYPGKMFAFLSENDQIVQIDVLSEERASLLGNVYIGKIKNIAANIEAAFVDIEGGQLCYVPLEDLKHAIYTNRNDKWRGIPAGEGCAKPRPGDELLIQVTKEALKTKLPGATGKISLTGTYMVLTTGNTKLGLSSKLSNPDKDRLRAALDDLTSDEYGFIVRTNAGSADVNVIRDEAMKLHAGYEELKKKALSRTCFSCIHRAEDELISELRKMRFDTIDKIVTDLPELKEKITSFIEEHSAETHPIEFRFYEDAQLPLFKLYSVEKTLQDALRERIWLKSGGYLVIQPTEALTVIDVNTGKFDGNKKPEETFRKINKEAAVEAARQLRLRNISGIIVVDFIDMKNPDHIQELSAIFKRELKKDPLKADFVDFTKLGLAEVTRKKVKKSLREQLL